VLLLFNYRDFTARVMLRRLLVAAVAGAAAAAPSLPHTLEARPWLAPGQPIAARVAALLAAMTLEEKAAQLAADCSSSLNYTAEPFAATGFGIIGIECSSFANASTTDVAGRIALARAYQLDALRVSRLGIPVTFHIETSHCGAAGGTIFPMGITQGASWDVDLVGEVAAVIGLEARAWGGTRGLSPEINVVTDPRFGRSEENFGSDPLLVTKMAERATVALQGGDGAGPDEYLAPAGVAAEAKHCCAYGVSGLDGGSADVDDKTLHDVYWKPWRAFIRAGGRGMMMAHNNLNSVPMHANAGVMKALFREQWGFKGFFGSDYGNVGALQSAHIAANLSQAASLAISAGVDTTFCDSAYSFGVVGPAVASGEMQLADVDRAVSVTLAQKFAAGLFDGALPDPANRTAIYTDASRALARRAAAEGAVLLTNAGGALPLNLAALRNIAVLGPMSGCPQQAPGGGGGGGGGGAACATTPGVDCDGDDLVKFTNVSTTAACCALCQANPQCFVAVLATNGQNICLLKSACSAPTPNAARVQIASGRAPPPPTPWTCEAMRSYLGGYSNLERATDAALDNHAHVVTVLEAALAAANASGGALNVTWAAGVDARGPDTSGIAPAAALAAAADVAVVVLGDGGESVGYDSSVSCGEGADRPSLDVPGVQLDLLEAVLATGTPTVVVLNHGRPVTFGTDYGGSLVSKFTAGGAPPLDKRAAAVLAAFRSGCEGGGAIWDVLTGAVSPSGRLPQSWPVAVGGARMPGINPWYLKFSTQGGSAFTLGTPFAPNYYFGHGLDYLSVTVAASSAVVDAAAMRVNVTVSLANAAPRAGKYVVQVYFSQARSRYARFQRMLAGFTKVAVPAGPGGAAAATVSVPFADLAHWDPVGQTMFLEQGDYTFSVCASSAEATCNKADAHAVVIPQTYTGL
jgi:beta-xylosidase